MLFMINKNHENIFNKYSEIWNKLKELKKVIQK